MRHNPILFRAFALVLGLVVSLGLLELIMRLVDASTSERWIARGSVILVTVLGGAGQRLLDRRRFSARL